MDADALSHHISSRFNEDLEQVRSRALEMGGMVERQLVNALNAITAATTVTIAQVTQDEKTVNQLERAIDDDCSRILATRAPAASDLRMVIAILKAITDLERIGDEAEKIAAISVRMSQGERPSGRYREVRNLGRLVLEMLRSALDAYARLDADLAFDVVRRDRLVDEEYETIQRRAVTFMMEDPRSIRRTLDVMWVVRALERVGDHAKNICEYVIYTVHGKDVRHIRLEDAELELRGAVRV
jgi:phosphate transport system protein